MKRSTLCMILAVAFLACAIAMRDRAYMDPAAVWSAAYVICDCIEAAHKNRI